MRTVPACVLLLVFAVGCSESSEPIAPITHVVEIERPTYSGLLFVENPRQVSDRYPGMQRADTIWHWVRSDDATQFRKGSAAEVERFETAFERLWPQINDTTEILSLGLPFERLSEWRRHYVGYSDSLGRAKLWVQFFHRSGERDTEWIPESKRDSFAVFPLWVDDGGPVYFETSYDVAADTIFSHWFNGPA